MSMPTGQFNSLLAREVLRIQAQHGLPGLFNFPDPLHAASDDELSIFYLHSKGAHCLHL
jgi:hypothetical protein